MGPMWFRSPLLAAALGALALAGCGSDDAALIPQGDADQLTALVGEAGEASAAGECERARGAVAEAEARARRPAAQDGQAAQGEPRGVAGPPRQAHRVGLRGARAEQTPTATPTATATETPGRDADPDTHPDGDVDARAGPPTVTVDPGATEEPPGTGGVPPEDDG